MKDDTETLLAKIRASQDAQIERARTGPHAEIFAKCPAELWCGITQGRPDGWCGLCKDLDLNPLETR